MPDANPWSLASLVDGIIPELRDAQRRGVTVAAERVADAERALIFGQSLPETQRRLRWLRGLLQSKVAKRGWNIARLPTATIVPREASRVANLHLGRRQDRSLCRHLRENLVLPANREAIAGQVLASAILYGGLVDRRLWQPFLDALQAWNSRGRLQETGQLYIRLQQVSDPPSSTDQQPVQRIWFADLLTEILIIRGDHGGYFGVSCPVRQALSTYCGGGPELPRMLQREASTRLRLRLPGVLAAYAEGKLEAQCPRAGVLARLVTDRPLRAGEEVSLPRTPQGTLPEPAVRAEAFSRDARRQYTELRRVMQRVVRKDRRTREADMREKVGQFMDGPGGMNLPIIRQLAAWVHDLLSTRKGRATGRMAPYRINTVTTYLSSIGPSLVAMVVDEDLAASPQDEIEELYEQVVSAGSSPVDRARRATALLSFHEVLRRAHPAVPPVHIAGSGGGPGPVDAALLTRGDYQRAQAILGNGKAAGIDTMRKVVLALGYHAGLRRTEVWKLRVCELAGTGEQMELYILQNHYRRLKYAASKRILPVGILLPQPERQWLEDLLRHRRTHLRTLPDALQQRALLFAEEGAALEPIPSHILFDPIQEALREASGDGSCTFHHARHAMASRLLAMLLLNGQPELWSGLPGLGLEDGLRARADQLRQREIGHRGANRGAVHLVSALTGHADVETTLRSYVHSMSFVLAAMLRRQEMVPDLTPDEARALSRPDAMTRPWISRTAPLVPVLSAWRKCHHAMADLEPATTRGRRRRPLTPDTPQVARALPGWRLVEVLLRPDRGEQELARDTSWSALDIARLRRAATEVLAQYPTRKTKSRVTGRELTNHFCMKMPVKHADIDMVDRIWRTVGSYEVLMGSKVQAELKATFSRRDVHLNEMTVPREPHRAKAFVAFLLRIGVPRSHIRVVYYPSANADAAERDADRRIWMRNLGVAECMFIERRRRLNRRSRVSFQVVGGLHHRQPQASYGFRFALATLSVLRRAEQRRVASLKNKREPPVAAVPTLLPARRVVRRSRTPAQPIRSGSVRGG